MSDGPGQLGTANALIYTSDAPRGHRIALSTTEIIYDAGKRRWILPGNAALADIPLRIAQLPFVEFAEAFRLPSDEDDLDGTLQTHDCVVEVGAHGQRFWVRGLYSTSAPVNAALRELCARANITPWRGEIAVIALAKGNKRPFLKRTNPVTTHIAIVKFVYNMKARARCLRPIHIGLCAFFSVGSRTTNLSQLPCGPRCNVCTYYESTICTLACQCIFRSICMVTIARTFGRSRPVPREHHNFFSICWIFLPKVHWHTNCIVEFPNMYTTRRPVQAQI